ncbi:unnamed protein product [Allacma fusca]|uniref:BTB domain-containing protein n=1 Tax=Allacma fusca TaxID=39272 RepID=A0A8J2M895_9HEXA|nr:unnamed protein product [Allacma fusca]
MSSSEYSNDDSESQQEELSENEQESVVSGNDTEDSDGSSHSAYATVSYVDKKVVSSGSLKLINVDSHDTSDDIHVGTNSFLKNSADWRLRDTLCVRCEDKAFFNVVLTLSEGRDKDSVQMAICVQRCPEATQVSFRRVRFRYCRVKIKFLGKFDNTVVTKFMHVDPDNKCNLMEHSHCDISSSFNAAFIPRATLKSICQKQRRTIGQSEDVEFIPVSVCAEILFSKPSYSTRPATSKPEADNWIKRLRRDTSFTDVTFKVKSKDSAVEPYASQGFAAHKCVLAARSPVFAAMFQSNMKETRSGEIELPDVNAAAMQAFLHSIYETSVSMLGVNTKKNLDVLALAHKYQIDDLVEGCTQNIVNIPLDEMPIKAALEVFAAGSKYQIPDLEFKALQVIKANKQQLNTSGGLTVLQEFIKSDSIVTSFLILGILL